MKIGLAFIGISHGLGRDCRHCFANQLINLIDPIREENNLKVYLTSYSSECQEEIIRLYRPTICDFYDYTGSHQVLNYIKGLKLMQDQDLDFIICTRFDIHFKKNINNFNFDFNKFNALFKERGWWDNMKFTTDNMFAFPKHMLNDFILVLEELYTNPSRHGQTDLHQAFSRMQNKIGEERTHIISPVDELSNDNLFYSLCSDKWGKK